MSDTMKVQPLDLLFRWILKEYEENESIFGIHRSLFFRPWDAAPYGREDCFGHFLATPIGPAAGPHTQLSQNIVCSWLSGGRFIELKTVQVMDELEIPRPCIDMEDEGYNVEWSQELKLDESADEYVNAWVLIHVLRRLLGHEGETRFGTIFNMSVGYDLEGIRGPAMTRFMDRLADASEAIEAKRVLLKREFPRYADIEIPSRITNNVTLSTMHGCPPGEIEKIARYLLEERGLHTAVKMNPTLLGRAKVDEILHDRLGYHEIHVPAATFEHDLEYDRAVELIRSLRTTASAKGLEFGVKLSNTLPAANHRDELAGEEMYMSGRALYPLTVHLFRRLSAEFEGALPVSFSGGADALNVTELLASGARSVTTVSDILKPGGYSRLLHYLEKLEEEMRDRRAGSLEELAADSRVELEAAAARSLEDDRYSKKYHPWPLPKVPSGLELFDCVEAPCMDRCAVRQDVPGYARMIARGETDRALEIILARNPLPGATGYACDHLCQTRCVRSDYDEPVAIRALKRFAFEEGSVDVPAAVKTGRRVAVIGAGPSGLAAASFLALNGVGVVVFEAKEIAGGMLNVAPAFRLPRVVIERDIERIASMGVEIRLSSPVTKRPEDLLGDGKFDAVYVACGYQRDTRLAIDGIDGEGGGIVAALDLLEQVMCGGRPDLGSRVLVIGGGNTAMDAARAAARLVRRPVTVVYRRTESEMPAIDEEIHDCLAEGNELVTLASPVRVVREKGRVVALECVRNELGEPDEDGRRRPVAVAGSEFRIEADTVIVAIGQTPDLAFLDGSSVTLSEGGAVVVDRETGLAGTDRIYAGGDVVRGPATIIKACADGRRAAEAICVKLGVSFEQFGEEPPPLSEREFLAAKRARTRKEPQWKGETFPFTHADGFGLVEKTLTPESARAEAARCVQCTHFCDKCVEVCPNRSNFPFFVRKVKTDLPLLACGAGGLKVVGQEMFVVDQERQIIHLDDTCNECGDCATFCVHHGRPYREKPRLFLKEEDFLLEKENAFFIEASVIRRREGGEESRLTLGDGELLYEDDRGRVRLAPDFSVLHSELLRSFEGTLSLRRAAEMALILEGVIASTPYLLR